ncbi:MAG TPA: hypothetical protein VKY90_14950 [Candidatus Dormibacteraeota bacterium]|nr:hypothetical protein [Candidatus Dormibacteraeota bacterium]
MAESTLPDPTDLARLLGELRERLRQGPASPGQPGIPVPPSPTTEPPDEQPGETGLEERRLDDDEALELEAASRRRLVEALLHGSARPRPKGHGLWWGVALAAGLALGIGLASMVGSTLAKGGPGHRTSTVVVQGLSGDAHGYEGDQAT